MQFLDDLLLMWWSENRVCRLLEDSAHINHSESNIASHLIPI